MLNRGICSVEKQCQVNRGHRGTVPCGESSEKRSCRFEGTWRVALMTSVFFHYLSASTRSGDGCVNTLGHHSYCFFLSIGISSENIY